MTSIFGHALASVAIGTSFSKSLKSIQFWLLGVLCAIFPDADVIGFKFGIKYENFFGHRGFTHSFVFALVFGFIIAWIFYRKNFFFVVCGIFYIVNCIA